MSVKLHVFECGRIKIDQALVYPGVDRGTSVIIPVVCGLVEHDGKKLLFDTGLHPDCITDPLKRWGEVAKFAMPQMHDGQQVTARLAALDVSPDDIDFVAISHLHNDHAGSNQFFPRARFLVQKADLDAAQNPDLASKLGFQRQDWDHGLEYQPLDGEHDVFGDGSVILFPTPGHTPGHQSLFVRVSSGKAYVMTGDAAYVQANLAEEKPVRITYDKEQAVDSIREIKRRLKEQSAQALFAHDLEQWVELSERPRTFQ